jgi:hypothetical protein
MSNTWEYRYAFRIQESQDVPVEFLGVYGNLTEREGDPVLAFFSPALNEGHFVMSAWRPPRLWLVFHDSLALLSLDHKSDAVSVFALRRQEFLGFGHREFLLDCWFSVYPGSSEGEPIEVRFPSRAEEKYRDLARLLVGWSKEERPITAPPGCAETSALLAGLPPKFTHLVEQHPEFGEVGEIFFQPRMVFGRSPEGEWPNFSLLLTSQAIIVLTDQYHQRWSEYGVEYVYFPLARVKLAEWIELGHAGRSAIRIYLEGASRQTSLCWNVFGGLKPYALRWLRAVKSSVKSIEGGDIQPQDMAALPANSHLQHGVLDDSSRGSTTRHGRPNLNAVKKTDGLWI